mgnify:CR=1 FL=1
MKNNIIEVEKVEINVTSLNEKDYICISDEIRVSEWYQENSRNKIFNLGSKGSIQFAEFNSNIVFTEWIPNFIDTTEYVSYNYLHNAEWIGNNATVYSAMNCPCGSGSSGSYVGYFENSIMATNVNDFNSQLDQYIYANV